MFARNVFAATAAERTTIRSDGEGGAEEEKEVEDGSEDEDEDEDYWGCDQRPARAPCAFSQPYLTVQNTN